MYSQKEINYIAMREAIRKHRQLKIDTSKQIDIFSIISHQKIPLAFQPLKNLSGVFIPAVPIENMVAGILINENHPRSRQRYTAAHEYCHLLRDNEASFDIETEVIARDELDKYQDRERIAEAFAAWFLMPVELIESQCRTMGINVKNIDPVSAYQLSLSLGTSYSATINHLFTLNKINWNTWKSLIGVPPKEIKCKISGGNDSIGWNDIWVLNEKNNNSTVYAQVGDELRLNLKEAPSTGYIWQIENIDQSCVEVKADFHNNNKQKSIGEVGNHNFVLSMKDEGICNILCRYKRPWLKEVAEDEGYILSAYIEKKRHGINISYLN